MLKLAARKAAHIITGSEYSKRQIVDHLNVAPNHVTVSYYGVGRHFVPEPRDQAYERVRHECGVNGRYLLFVGNLKPHKNVDGLLRAFALIRSATASDVELLIIGEDRFGGPKLRELAARLGIGAATKFAGRVTMGLLRSAYAAAELTVLPSFEEGFGLPVLESMACGTPVACSRAASLPEIGGDAAEYFDPNSCDSMAHAIEGLLFASPEQRKNLGQKGLQRAKLFSWAECTSRHLDVYRRYCQA
jgi:alpha-1,3-rhamnosyl/mannosyltransferase